MSNLDSIVPKVLSALIDDRVCNEKKQDVIDRLSGDMFTDPIHSAIFSAIQTLIESGEDACPISVPDSFQHDHNLARAVSDCCINLYALCGYSNIEHYTQQVVLEAAQEAIGRDIRNKFHNIYKNQQLSETEKRNALEDAIDISKEQSDKLSVADMPSTATQQRTMSDRIFKPVPEAEFIFHGQMIPKDELTVMPGFNGSGKSYMALQIGIAKAMGKAYMMDSSGAKYFDPVKSGRVLILSVEDDSVHYSRRAQSIINHFPSIDEDDKLAIVNNLFFTSFSEMGLDGQLTIKTKEGRIERSPTWRKVKKFIVSGAFELVIIDPLHYCINAGDENSNGDMGQAVQVLIELAKATGAAVLAPCHTSETNPIKPRGATSITDRSRSGLCLATIAKLIEKKVACSMPDISDIPQDYGSVLRLAMTKNSHGRLMPNYWLFERTRTGVMFPIKAKSNQVDLHSIILGIIGDEQMLQTKLFKEIAIEYGDIAGNQTVRRTVIKMVDAGILVEEKAAKNGKILWVNNSHSG